MNLADDSRWLAGVWTEGGAAKSDDHRLGLWSSGGLMRGGEVDDLGLRWFGA